MFQKNMIDLKNKKLGLIPFSNYFSRYVPNRVSPKCENIYSASKETSRSFKEVYQCVILIKKLKIDDLYLGTK